MVLGVFQSPSAVLLSRYFGKENRIEMHMLYVLYVILCFLCYDMCYDIYVCRLGHMTHMTNKTPNGLWAYDLLS